MTPPTIWPCPTCPASAARGWCAGNGCRRATGPASAPARGAVWAVSPSVTASFDAAPAHGPIPAGKVCRLIAQRTQSSKVSSRTRCSIKSRSRASIRSTFVVSRCTRSFNTMDSAHRPAWSCRDLPLQQARQAVRIKRRGSGFGAHASPRRIRAGAARKLRMPDPRGIPRRSLSPSTRPPCRLLLPGWRCGSWPKWAWHRASAGAGGRAGR